MVVGYGEQTTLNAIKAAAKCSRCGSKDVEVRVWKDTWSGPR